MDKATELIVSNLLGLVIGLGTSFFSWWVLFHWYVPVIVFSSHISKAERRSGDGYRYRVKVINRGKRAIIGLEVQARLAVKWESNNNIRWVTIPLTSDGDKKLEVMRLAPRGNRILNFYLRPVTVFRTGTSYTAEFKAKANDGKLSMEDLLALGRVAYLQVNVSAFDEFSGARRIFQSKQYSLLDIKAGRFRGLEVYETQSAEAEAKESFTAQSNSDDA